MPDIGDVNIKPIRDITIPPVRSVFTGLPEPIITNSPPVTVTIGSPIVNIPGCVEVNPNGPGLIDDDPNGNVVFCDGQLPSFDPLNYEPNQLILTGPPEAMPKLEETTPPVPKTSDLLNQKLPGPPVVTVTEEPVEVEEELSFVEEYLPSAQEVSTTVTIATAAAAAAVFGKPLAEFLLKLIKPAVKKIIQKVQKNMGKEDVILSVAERRQLQRDLRR
jgi:hypothetical protein|tara:strand:- start:760 stop:1413 length:654 start_codon:yes stop_codon:yes gene_type:complete